MTATAYMFDEKAYAQLLRRTLPRVIKNERENKRLTEILLALDGREHLSKEESEVAELIATLVEEYERRRYPMAAPTPRAMLKHLMEARGFSHKDVWKLFGSKGIASEVLNGKRSISITHVKKLSEFFQVSPALFI